jgi:hypothetical protein
VKLRNNFSEETKGLFCFNNDCWSCGGSWGDGNADYHHILGRISNSPLNLAPLCLGCHAKHIKMKLYINRCDFVTKTIKYLLKEGYELNKNDLKFYLENRELYGKKKEES